MSESNAAVRLLTSRARPAASVSPLHRCVGCVPVWPWAPSPVPLEIEQQIREYDLRSGHHRTRAHGEDVLGPGAVLEVPEELDLLRLQDVRRVALPQAAVLALTSKQRPLGEPQIL